MNNSPLTHGHAVNDLTPRVKFPRRIENLIADLRGVPIDRGRSIDRKTKPIDSVVEVVLKKYKINQPRLEDTIMAHWRTIVGDRTAHRCRPQKLTADERKLIILAANSVVRSELKFNKRQIIQRIQSLPNCSDIKDIIISHG